MVHICVDGFQKSILVNLNFETLEDCDVSEGQELAFSVVEVILCAMNNESLILCALFSTANDCSFSNVRLSLACATVFFLNYLLESNELCV